MFVSDTNERYREFRTALHAHKLWDAMSAARAMSGRLSLLDALELTLLAAEADGGKIYEELAARWLARVTVEKELPLESLAIAVGVCQKAAKGEAKNAFQELSSFM
jgi:hypothetical protein